VTVQHPCTALFESLGRDEEGCGALLDLFLEDSLPRVAAIRSAIDRGDIANRLAAESTALLEVIRRYRSAFLHAA
jgi:hypothetical protein